MDIIKNILIFPAGTEIAYEIVNALKYSKFVNLYGGTSVKDHSEFVYKHLISDFPFVTDDDFLVYLNKVIEEYNIDCVYPAHDSVALFLSEHRDEILAQVIISNEYTTRICRSKKETYDFFRGEKFVPIYYKSVGEVFDFPVFVKPTVGQGSNGACKITNKKELFDAYEKDPTIVICEYLPGMEYTVDCFTDSKGNLLVSELRDRQRIRMGISVRSEHQNADISIINIANRINEMLEFKGAWFFQVKRNSEGKYRLLEISPRIPGTMGVSRNLGINFPLLTLFAFWGYDVSIIKNDYSIILDRAFHSSYCIHAEYDHVYIDFDDTLIFKGKVNEDIIRYLYQAKNQGKKLHLLSRHIGNIEEDMREYCLCVDLFDDIIVVKADDEKYENITELNSIFIDDSFAERKKVHDKIGIPVFDLDMIESLMDWRV